MSEAGSANNGVYFLSLELENIRCFKKQKLDLSNGEGNYAKWTVILGNNGIGKTTLLEILQKNNTSLSSRFYRYDSNACKWVYHYINKKTDLLFTGEFTFAKNESNTNVKSTREYSTDIHEVILPNLYFYNASRKPSSNEFINAEAWLKDTYLFSEAKSKFKERFNSVKTTLVDLLPDVTEIDIYYPDENKPELKIRFLVNNIWLPLDTLSLGYQSMIAWIVDLAAHLFNRYPDSKNPIAEPAVVLIDEIDLHLHPKWQREIMRYLSERFTNTQFIVTAHSPLIVQAAEDENANIVVLRREGDEVIIDQQPKAIHGWRVDQLLASDLFGLKGSRSPKSEQRLKERDEILNKPELTETDKKRLEELRYIPMAESPEDIEAMSIIREAAQLLKEKYK